MNSQGILLANGRFYVDGEFRLCDVRVHGSTITEIGSQLRPLPRERMIPLEGRPVVPGLINCHDHLEFNLFPHLGRPLYKNYLDWSSDIQRNHQREIQGILRVPLRLRLLWGAYKNILSGVTTVVHHNKYYPYFRFRFPVDVFKDYAWIHSLRLEKRDLKRIITERSRRTFIHLAEGIDSIAEGELSELIHIGGLSERTVVIHGVGLRPADIDALEAAGAAVVWCPSSNFYLFGQTAPVESMVGRIPLLLGTDSTLTGSSGLLEELRFAQKVTHLLPRDILRMVTETPSRILGLSAGDIRVGAQADLLIYESSADDPSQGLVDLVSAEITCLIRRGKPIFGNLEFAMLAAEIGASFSKFCVDDTEKFLTGNLPRLIRRIQSFDPHFSPDKWGIPSALIPA